MAPGSVKKGEKKGELPPEQLEEIKEAFNIFDVRTHYHSPPTAAAGLRLSPPHPGRRDKNECLSCRDLALVTALRARAFGTSPVLWPLWLARSRPSSAPPPPASWTRSMCIRRTFLACAGRQAAQRLAPSSARSRQAHRARYNGERHGL